MSPLDEVHSSYEGGDGVTVSASTVFCFDRFVCLVGVSMPSVFVRFACLVGDMVVCLEARSERMHYGVFIFKNERGEWAKK
jgi:hypothetical protein